MKHYILDGHEVVETDLATAAGWRAVADRTVAKTRVGEVEVSTVFLQFDHNFSDEGPPVLFETMVFGGEHDELQERYCTWDEAEAGHARVVEMVKGERMI